jgi:hypothetical protein
MEQQQQQLGLHMAAAHNLCAYRCAHTERQTQELRMYVLLCSACVNDKAHHWPKHAQKHADMQGVDLTDGM